MAGSEDETAEIIGFTDGFTRLGSWWLRHILLGFIPVIGGVLSAAAAVPVLLGLRQMRDNTRDGDRLRFLCVLVVGLVAAGSSYVELVVAFVADNPTLNGSPLPPGPSSVLSLIGMGLFAGAMRKWVFGRGLARKVIDFWRYAMIACCLSLISAVVGFIALYVESVWRTGEFSRDGGLHLQGTLGFIGFVVLGFLALAPLVVTWNACTETRKHLEWGLRPVRRGLNEG